MSSSAGIIIEGVDETQSTRSWFVNAFETAKGYITNTAHKASQSLTQCNLLTKQARSIPLRSKRDL
jgi:hypothetical protein